MSAEHYAEAFSPQPGRCFRLVGDAAGRPEHCSEPPAWSGIFRDQEGKPHRVEACQGHRGGLEQARPLHHRAHYEDPGRTSRGGSDGPLR
jgi:hypothetical protein